MVKVKIETKDSVHAEINAGQEGTIKGSHEFEIGAIHSSVHYLTLKHATGGVKIHALTGDVIVEVNSPHNKHLVKKRKSFTLPKSFVAVQVWESVKHNGSFHSIH